MACRYRSSMALLLLMSASAAPRQHSVLLGKWQTVHTLADSGESREVKIRRLLVDDQVREYTSGPAHDVTDRLFVVRRAYRVNDALPQDRQTAPRWVWRLDGWISVDRATGHVTQLNLPAFDAETSEASWYRDYAAYCGTSDDGAKAYLVVWQLGKRRPVLRKEFAGPGCDAPKWERNPSRVTFMAAGEKSSYLVHARGADPQPETGEEEAQDKR
jgi:hypothetical protein